MLPKPATMVTVNKDKQRKALIQASVALHRSPVLLPDSSDPGPRVLIQVLDHHFGFVIVGKPIRDVGASTRIMLLKAGRQVFGQLQKGR